MSFCYMRSLYLCILQQNVWPNHGYLRIFLFHKWQVVVSQYLLIVSTIHSTICKTKKICGPSAADATPCIYLENRAHFQGHFMVTVTFMVKVI